MKLFITGISGLLGLNLALQFRDRFEVSGSYNQHPVHLASVEALQLDLDRPGELQEALNAVQPDVIIHTAALANVDQCQNNPELAHRMNVEYSETVGSIARSLGAYLVSISTDHLFPGNSACLTEDAEPAPINTYGRTKLLGEQAVLAACPDGLVIRTNFFGWGTPARASFSDWILGALERGEALNMFQDVYFSPILINILGEHLAKLIELRASGILNVGGSERISKHEFALKLCQVFGYETERINATCVSDSNLTAQRPKDMSLSVSKVETLLKTGMPTVVQSLERLKEMGEEGWTGELNKAMESAKTYP